jgi:hypothetical protein
MPSSSGENIFRRSPVVSIKDRNPIGSPLHKKRYNGYVKITSSTGGTLPANGTGFSDTYTNNRPTVILNSVTIQEGQDYGSLLQAEVQYTCFTKSQFETYAKYFMLLRNGKDPVKINISFGAVGAPYAHSQGSVNDLFIYNFGYQLDKNNSYVCTFKAMGSAKLLGETDVNASNRIADLGLTYKDPAADGAFNFDLAVTTIPQYVKYLAQDDGTTITVDIDPICKAVTGGHILIMNHPNNQTPDTTAGKAIYKLLQGMGFYGDDASKLIYCTLELLVDAINQYIKTDTGDLASKTFVCNGTVTKGSYITDVCSADPYRILLVGGEIGDYTAPDLDDDEQLKTSTVPGILNPLSGGTYDYSKIFLSYSYLISKWSNGTVSENTAEGASDPSDKPANVKFSVGRMLTGIFDDIAAETGGAVGLGLHEDPNDRSKLLVIPLNEKTSTITPVTFDPINGDGITRECIVSCNPASADAYAIAAGDATLQSSTVEASGGTPSDGGAAARASAIETIKKIKTSDMATAEFNTEQIAGLRTALTTLINASSPEQVAEGMIPVTAAQWPLKLQIVLDGIYGFRFGDVVDTTFLPNTYRGAGLKAAFLVQRVNHTIANNDWSTSLETVCDLVNKGA